MAEKLRIIPLGGLNEIGKNMTVYEYGGDIMVVDCGLGFPDNDMLGIDIVIPDMSFLVRSRNRVRGLVITHGHEDHIGAVPYLLRDVKTPIHCTALTAGLLEVKLEESGQLAKADLVRHKAGDVFNVGCFQVEFIHVNHSIADSVALCITTPLGKIIHTGDFKIDPTPVVGEMIDLARFGQLGKQGVLALLSDSTNVERPGYTMSERKVGESLDALFKNCANRIIVTTFSSNVHRLQQIIDAAVRYDRKVAITGRSMENILRVSIQLDYMNIPPNTIVEMSQIKGLPKNKVCIITTGSQGEPMSALYRMAFSGHKQLEIQAGDRVVISASPIPGNEKTISKVINELFRKGADVVYERLAEVHVSGHACQEELKLILALVKPTYFMPLHGEFRHLRAHATLAQSMGVLPKHVFIGQLGRVWEITAGGAKLAGNVQAGNVLVDGLGVGDVGAVVLRDRKILAQDGLIVVVVALDSASGQLAAGPDIVSRGFVYVKESESLMEEMRELAKRTVQEALAHSVSDWTALKSAVRSAMSDFLYKKTKRVPMILPIIMEE